MTEREIPALSPSFSAYLGRYRDCFLQNCTMTHFDSYGRALLSDLPRKCVEPIALGAGTAVRTLQGLLVTAEWDQERARTRLQNDLAAVVETLPDDGLGTIAVFDETSCQKWVDQTPGVQRQYLGCLGKIDNGIVTVHAASPREAFRRFWTPTCICLSRGTGTASAAGRRTFPTTCATVPIGGLPWINWSD